MILSSKVWEHVVKLLKDDSTRFYVSATVSKMVEFGDSNSLSLLDLMEEI
ncbi:hypothetical protein [Candidatus Ichthyocystis hellenicum]|nr:hypothetical protein [Candidatus Ichthyocystis hellenicum]